MKKLGFLFTLLVFLTACSEDIPQQGDESIVASNYSEASNWLSLPANPTQAVDVFYIYPTVWSAARDRYPLSDINYSPMRDNAQDAISLQASAFQTAGNVYAPYYRQFDADFLLSQSPDQQNKYLRGVPKADILAAFDYYINNYNQGRPFILVGHSQGAAMVKELLLDYMRHYPEVYSRMVAAYAIGWSITKDELDINRHLKFAKSATDTGVIISYNTEAPKIKGNNPTVLEGAMVINPITWSTDAVYAPAEQNLGSMLQSGSSYNKVLNLADARINPKRGTLICSSVDPSIYSDNGNGIYHRYDIAFYYNNLRQNAEDRAKAYLDKAAK